ncbi:MAG: ATP-dependent Clp protease ATP-binding subunit ClpX, partial [Proteobacteria bacterium]|nr:ATP-dependent Clp protease ATP-binding subunit ClpX [Pseudomonadota bacterium]
VEGLLLDTMFDLPTEQDIAEVVVDKDVVEGRKEPVRVLKGKEEAA